MGQFSGDIALSIFSLDAIPSKGFQVFWKKVGDENGYNVAMSKDSGLPLMALSALRSDWKTWAALSDASRFYLSGLIVNFKRANRQVKFTDENFKSQVLGLSQCMNLMYQLTKSFADLKIETTGTVEESFALCGMARVTLTK